MCIVLLFLEPSRFFQHTGFSRLLQPSLHLSQSFSSKLFKPLVISSHFSTSHIFFCHFFDPLTSTCRAFTGSLSLSILSICPSHRNLYSLKNFPISPLLSFYELSSLIGLIKFRKNIQQHETVQLHILKSLLLFFFQISSDDFHHDILPTSTPVWLLFRPPKFQLLGIKKALPQRLGY